jgi:prephenate dehydrogenase
MAKLAIIGTGFVGASLSLALRRSKLFEVISGYDRDRTRLAAVRPSCSAGSRK